MTVLKIFHKSNSSVFTGNSKKNKCSTQDMNGTRIPNVAVIEELRDKIKVAL